MREHLRRQLAARARPGVGSDASSSCSCSSACSPHRVAQSPAGRRPSSARARTPRPPARRLRARTCSSPVRRPSTSAVARYDADRFGHGCRRVASRPIVHARASACDTAVRAARACARSSGPVPRSSPATRCPGCRRKPAASPPRPARPRRGCTTASPAARGTRVKPRARQELADLDVGIQPRFEAPEHLHDELLAEQHRRVALIGRRPADRQQRAGRRPIGVSPRLAGCEAARARIGRSLPLLHAPPAASGTSRRRTVRRRGGPCARR